VSCIRSSYTVEHLLTVVASPLRADGLMGMAFPEIAQITATAPFFNTLIANNAVASGEFGFKLASNGAVLFLGGVDPNSSSGNLKSVPVTQKGFWQVDMDSVTVGGQEALSTTSAIIDTGTTLIVGVPDQVAQVYQSIPGAQDASSTVGEGFFTFPCNSNPQVAMTFGGVSYDISSTFNLGTVEEGSSDCVGGIVGQDTGRMSSFPSLLFSVHSPSSYCSRCMDCR
jgi:cathepsin D